MPVILYYHSIAQDVISLFQPWSNKNTMHCLSLLFCNLFSRHHPLHLHLFLLMMYTHDKNPSSLTVTILPIHGGNNDNVVVVMLLLYTSKLTIKTMICFLKWFDYLFRVDLLFVGRNTKIVSFWAAAIAISYHHSAAFVGKKNTFSLF